MVSENNPGGLHLQPLMDRPEKVAIVALGQSCKTFLQEAIASGSRRQPWDEVWTVNRGLRTFRHDKLFCMDDFRWLEQRDKGYAEYLQKHDRPIFTSTPYPEYPQAVPYPLQQVIECIGNECFAVNTVAYMLAYAIYIGVKEVSIYGADFFYPNGNKAEEGGQAVTFLLGVCNERKIFYRIPQTSTLLYSHKARVVGGELRMPHYGYHRRDELVAKAARAQPIQAPRTKADGSLPHENSPVRDQAGPHDRVAGEAGPAALG